MWTRYGQATVGGQATFGGQATLGGQANFVGQATNKGMRRCCWSPDQQRQSKK